MALRHMRAVGMLMGPRLARPVNRGVRHAGSAAVRSTVRDETVWGGLWVRGGASLGGQLSSSQRNAQVTTPLSRGMSSGTGNDDSAAGTPTAAAAAGEEDSPAAIVESSDPGVETAHQMSTTADEASETAATTAEDPAAPVEGSEAAEVLNLWMQETINQQNKKELEPPARPSYDIATVNATYNNTIVTITKMDGSPINWASCGSVGFKGAKRSTSFAAQTAGQRAAEVAAGKGVERVRVLLKGLGPGRSTAVKGLKLGGLGIVEITDRTPEPHNGCRPRKARRL